MDSIIESPATEVLSCPAVNRPMHWMILVLMHRMPDDAGYPLVSSWPPLGIQHGGTERDGVGGGHGCACLVGTDTLAQTTGRPDNKGGETIIRQPKVFRQPAESDSLGSDPRRRATEGVEGVGGVKDAQPGDMALGAHGRGTREFIPTIGNHMPGRQTTRRDGHHALKPATGEQSGVTTVVLHMAPDEPV